jgi:hypothetical protein
MSVTDERGKKLFPATARETPLNVAADHTLGTVAAVSVPSLEQSTFRARTLQDHGSTVLAGLEGSLDVVITTIQALQRRNSMAKGNDKKPKPDKSKRKTGISPYKAAQGAGKPAIGPLARKTGR